jgi:hypothetical protein
MEQTDSQGLGNDISPKVKDWFDKAYAAVTQGVKDPTKSDMLREATKRYVHGETRYGEFMQECEAVVAHYDHTPETLLNEQGNKLAEPHAVQGDSQATAIEGRLSP